MKLRAARRGNRMSSDPFVEYYEKESSKDSTIVRFTATKSAVERAAAHFGMRPPPWNVADVGCGAGTQAAIWAREGHSIHGLDINEPLIELGRKRAAAEGLSIDFSVGSATSLPWQDGSMDVCLCPELLEHVADWQACIAEAHRVLRPGGILYLSTTNKLCPVQHEFDVPGYSWFPPRLKRHYEELAVTTRRELVKHAQFPAINWFSYYGLRRHLETKGFDCLDRFDVAALSPHSRVTAAALWIVCSVSPARWLGHVFTPYTVAFARKR